MAKVRTDSWAAKLTEDQAWALFYKARQCEWQVAARWAVKEFGLERAPSRTGFYEWKAAMAKDEHRHSMEQGLLAQAMVREGAASNDLKDGEARRALEQKAVEIAMLTGDVKTAKSLYELTLAIRDRELHAAELDIKERSQKTKDEQLRLAREKFEAAEKRLERVAEIADAARGGKVDPAKVADEIDRILGRKK